MESWRTALLDIYRAALREGGPATALQVTSIASTMEPDALWWAAMHATSLMDVGLFSQAERILRDIHPLYEKKALVETQLGEICQETGRLEEAEVWFRKAVETGSSTTMTWIYLGAFLAQCERIHEACDAFTRALDAEGDVDEAHFNLGRQRVKLNDLVGARKCFMKALEIDGEDKAARDALTDVETAIRVRDELRHITG